MTQNTKFVRYIYHKKNQILVWVCVLSRLNLCSYKHSNEKYERMMMRWNFVTYFIISHMCVLLCFSLAFVCVYCYVYILFKQKYLYINKGIINNIFWKGFWCDVECWIVSLLYFLNCFWVFCMNVYDCMCMYLV